MRSRHLDYPPQTPVTELGPAALEELLDRGDLKLWAPLAAAIRADPDGPLADTVLRLCREHPMYGTSALWTTWITRLRGRPDAPALPGAPALRELRRSQGVSQQELGRRMGMSQSDVSKVERRADLRLSTVRAYVAALGAELDLVVRFPDGETTVLGSAQPEQTT